MEHRGAKTQRAEDASSPPFHHHQQHHPQHAQGDERRVRFSDEERRSPSFPSRRRGGRGDTDDPVAKLAADLRRQQQQQQQQSRRRAPSSTQESASSSSSAGTAILDALLAIVERTAEPASRDVAGDQSRKPSSSHDVSADSKGSTEQAEAEVSIEHVSVLGSPQRPPRESRPPPPPPQTAAAPEKRGEGRTESYHSSPSAPSSVCSSSSSSPGPTRARLASPHSHGIAAAASTAMVLAPKPEMAAAPHPRHPLTQPVNTLILSSVDGSLHDVASAGGAWRSQFAANAQRLLRETQQQVQELLYYKEAYEAAMAAHTQEREAIQELKRRVEEERRSREADRAAHEHAMEALSGEALRLSRELEVSRAAVQTATAALESMTGERDAARVECDELAARVDTVTRRAASEAEAAKTSKEQLSLAYEQQLRALQLRVDALAQEKTAVERRRDDLEKLNMDWETRLFRERRRWWKKLAERQPQNAAEATAAAAGAEQSNLMQLSGIAREKEEEEAEEGEEDLFPELTQSEQDSLLDAIGATGMSLRTENEKVLLRHIQYLTQQQQQLLHAAAVQERKEVPPDEAEEAARLRRQVELLQQERNDLAAALEASKLRRETEETSRSDENESSLSLSRQLRGARQRVGELEARVRAQQQQLSRQEHQLHLALVDANQSSVVNTREECARQLREILQNASIGRSSLAAMDQDSRDPTSGPLSTDASADFSSCLSALSDFVMHASASLRAHEQRATIAREEEEAEMVAVQERVRVLQADLEAARQATREAQQELQLAAERSSRTTGQWGSLSALLGKQHQLLQNAMRDYGGLPVVATPKGNKKERGDEGSPRETSPTVSANNNEASSVMMPLVTTARLTVEDEPEALLQQAERSHQHLLRLLSATRELKTSLQLAKQRHKEEQQQHAAALLTERNRGKQLEGRITNLVKDAKASEAKRREELANLQHSVESRLAELLSQLDAAETAATRREQHNASLQQRIREVKQESDEAARKLAATEAEMQELTRERIALTEALRDAVRERDNLASQRHGLVEAAQAMEERAAADREHLLYLYALLTQWTRWTAWVMLRHDALQLQKRWLLADQQASCAELEKVKGVLQFHMATQGGGVGAATGLVTDGSDLWPDSARKSTSAVAAGGSRRRLRVVALAVLAVVTVRGAARERHRAQNLAGFSSVSIIGASTVAAAPYNNDGDNDESNSAWRGEARTSPRAAAAPRVVFFAEDTTDHSRELPRDHDTAEKWDDSSSSGRHSGSAADRGTTPFLSLLSFPGTVQLSADHLRDRVVLPDTVLPPVHELVGSLQRLFKREGQGKRTAGAYDLIECLLHTIGSRVATRQSPAPLRYLSRRFDNKTIPRPPPSQLLPHLRPSTTAAVCRGGERQMSRPAVYAGDTAGVAAQLERVLERKAKELADLEDRYQEVRRDMAVLAEQNAELGRVLEVKRDGQEAIARDLAALEDLVRSRPTGEEVQALRERLLATGDELQKERERRHEQEDKVAEHCEREVALLAVRQQLQNEIRSLKIELGRAAAVRHNEHAQARREQQQQRPAGSAPKELSALSSLLAAEMQRRPTTQDTSLYPIYPPSSTSIPPLSHSADLHEGDPAHHHHHPQPSPSSLTNPSPFGNPAAAAGISITLESSTAGRTPNTSWELYQPVALREKQALVQERMRKGEEEDDKKHATQEEASEAEAVMPSRPPSHVDHHVPSSISVRGSHASASSSSTVNAQGPGERDSERGSLGNPLPQPSSHTTSRRSTLPKQPSPFSESESDDEPGTDGRLEGDAIAALLNPASDGQAGRRPVISLQTAYAGRESRSSSAFAPSAAGGTDSLSPPPRPHYNYNDDAAAALSHPPPPPSVRPLRYESSDSRDAALHRGGGGGGGSSADHASLASSREAAASWVAAAKAGGQHIRASFDDRYVSLNPPSTATAQASVSLRGSSGSINSSSTRQSLRNSAAAAGLPPQDKQ